MAVTQTKHTVDLPPVNVSVDQPPFDIAAGPLVEDAIAITSSTTLDARGTQAAKPMYVEFATSFGGGSGGVSFSNVLPFQTIALFIKRTAAGGAILFDSRLRTSPTESYPGPSDTVGAWAVLVLKAIPDPDSNNLKLLLLNHKKFAA